MKFLSSVTFLLIAFNCLAQGPRFEVKFSEPLALFVYVEHLSSRHPDNPFKKQFAASIYNREKYKALIAQFDTLRTNYTYEFDGFPYGSKMPGMTEFHLKKNLVSSANLKEFKKRSLGLIPNTTLLQLSSILYEFQLVYRDLVYQPNKSAFEKQLKDLTELVKTKNLSTYFDKGLSFYRSYWDDSLPFEIAFYPFPNSAGFSAEAFCNNAISALPPETRDYNMLLGVVLHEIYHILYDEQPAKVKRNIVKWFNANDSKTSAYAYLLFNEALATCLGNGYVYESLNGKKDEGFWYDRKYIDQMAKKIYPMVADYIAQKKGIDQGFVNIYIKFYEENFSEWMNEMSNLMCYRYVITDKAADFDVLRKFYPYSSLSQYEDEVSAKSIDRLKECPITKIIIVSKDNEEKLELIKSKFFELNDWKYKAKQDFLLSFFLEDRTHLIIVNTIKKTTEEMFGGRVTLPPPTPVVK